MERGRYGSFVPPAAPAPSASARGHKVARALVLAAAVSLGALALLQAPAAAPGAPTSTADAAVQLHDRDEHGCIASAGFEWCETRQECFPTQTRSAEGATDE